eukprot:TRINITY_DN1218_c0_g1_i1.p2 TRINITY_DN1218_c0_g1~~TRINITY_DN1218_c0_g1_i1.p2  ORF type:complete len:405 (+),score=56.41 TRINITY_DN1218_c0_g1_i1:141-1217(+)
MAKLEERDPRWIVEERQDGTNVNNWHWQEKDCIPWTKQRLSELFKGLSLLTQPSTTTYATAMDVSSVNGEAFLNVRKKKLIPSYELEIKIDWIGSHSGQEVKGQIVLPYVAEENHDEDPEIKITLQSNNSREAEELKQMIFKQGKDQIIKAINTFVEEFYAGKPANVQIEAESNTKSAQQSNGSQHNQNSQNNNNKPNTNGFKNDTNSKQTKTLSNGNSKGRNIRIQNRFYASSKDLFHCFTDAGRIQGYSQSPAQVDAKVGGSFSMYGGSIQGVFKELVEGELIVMDWRFSDWGDDVYSVVRIELSENEPGNTEVILTQNGIPEEDKYGNVDVVGRVEQGWQQQVFYRIKAVFGYGI